MQYPSKVLGILFISLLLSACSFQQYQAKPIDPQANLAKIADRDPNSPAFHEFLISRGVKPDQLPLQTWGLEELFYCALFFHPSINLSKAKSHAATLSVATTAKSAIPTINANLARSNDPDPIKKPYALGLSIDMPLDIANKRQIRVDSAKHLVDIVELQIAQTGWEIRSRLTQTWQDYQAKLDQIRVLSEEQAQYQSILEIYKKRVELGYTSNVELSTASIQMQINAIGLNQAKQQLQTLHHQLASHTGLTLAQFDKLTLKRVTSNQSIQDWSLPDLKKNALLNRLDLRIALLRYASMEAKLKLEIANQYPDLIISPGYAYEFGDSVWSLGLSGLLSLLHKNELAIAEATQLREVEAAQFEVLQNQIIADTTSAYTELMEARTGLIKQKKLLDEQQSHEKRMANLFNAGQIDRLNFTLAKLETVLAEKTLAAAQYQYNDALRKLENVVEKPLNSLGVNDES